MKINKQLKLIVPIIALSSSSYAIDNKLSGFLTIGGAISDKPYTYSSYINNNGTIKKDSIFGLQLDSKINNKLSTTFQGVFKQSIKNDNNFDLTLNWGFLSYRPANDWLIRAGKVRIPFYLLSQNKDVGVTYDFARLPSEIYTAGAYDNGVGAIVSKSFELDDGTLNIDGFYVNLNIPIRTYIPTTNAPIFPKYNFHIYGVSTDYITDYENKYRIGLYHAEEKDLGANIDFITLGAEYNFENSIKILTELINTKTNYLNSTTMSQAFYIAGFKSYGNWTNYLRYGIKAPKNKGYESYTLGSTYSISTLQKIKLEYSHINGGLKTNSFIDNDKIYSNENINVFSLSYNYAF